MWTDFTNENETIHIIKICYLSSHWGEANTISAQTFSLVNAVFLCLRNKQVAILHNFPPSLSLPYPTQDSVAHYLQASTLVPHFLTLT